MIVHFPLCAIADTFAGVASVIDGDTIEIHGQRVRLAGKFDMPWDWWAAH